MTETSKGSDFNGSPESVQQEPAGQKSFERVWGLDKFGEGLPLKKYQLNGLSPTVEPELPGMSIADTADHLCPLSQDDMGRLQQTPSEHDLSDWPDAPVLLTAAPIRCLQLQDSANPCAIPINTGRSIEFETELFRGRAVIWAQGLRSSPEGLFAGERRKTSITVQGRFKADLLLEDIVTGQEFARPLHNLPATWLLDKVLIKLAKRINPSMDIGRLAAPYLLGPVVAIAQIVNVSRPGEEPDPSQPISEDMRLFDPTLTNSTGGPMDALQRKHHFWDRRNRARRSFTKGHVWTFQMYQHFVDLSTYELNMLYCFDLGRHLDGQPLQLMMKDRASGKYLFSFQAWHRKLLAAAHAAANRSGSKYGIAAVAAKSL
ncbi:g1652 [Coccomyxa elongata]